MEIIKKCEWCSQNYVAKTPISRFCSKGCCDKAYKEKLKKEKEQGVVKESKVDFEKTCEWCGKSYIAHRTTSHYCSRICCQQAYRNKEQEDKQRTKKDKEIIPYRSRVKDIGSKEFLTPADVGALLDLGRATVYRYLAEGAIRCRQFRGKTIIWRKDIDCLFSGESEYHLRKSLRVLQSPSGEVSGEYYTLREIMGKFNVGRKLVWNRAKQFNIEKKVKGKTALYKKSQVDKYFADLIAAFDPSEYYTPEQMMQRFNMTHDAVISFAQRHNLPRIKRQKSVYYSKAHVDSIKTEGKPLDVLYYTIPEIMKKYGLTNDQVKYYVHHYDIERIKKWRALLIRRTDFDRIYMERWGKNIVVAQTPEIKKPDEQQMHQQAEFEAKVKNVPVNAPIEEPQQEETVEEVEYGLKKGYVNAEQISERYKLTKEWVHYLTRKKQVPRIYSNGLYFYEEKTVEHIFSKYLSQEGIEEWYTADDVERIFNINGDQRNRFAHKHKIPTKREYGIMYYSKLHMDFAKNPGSKYAGEYYKVEEIIEKYHVERKIVYEVLRRKKIPKVHDGKLVLLLKSVVDKEFSALNKPDSK